MKKKEISESVMAKAFEKCLTNKKFFAEFPNFNRVFRDFVCRQGIADFLAVAGPRIEKKTIKKIGNLANLITESSTRIFSLLKHSSPRSKEYIKGKSGLSFSTVSRVLDHLGKENLIKETAGGKFTLSPTWYLPKNLELWAFELKVNNWQRALFQALQYKAFATRVVTVFPKKKERILKKHIDKFKKMNIGVIVFDHNSFSYKILLKPRKNNPQSRMHYFFSIFRIAQLYSMKTKNAHSKKVVAKRKIETT